MLFCLPAHARALLSHVDAQLQGRRIDWARYLAWALAHALQHVDEPEIARQIRGRARTRRFD